MFTKLRNKFLLLNLSVTSGVIILAFGFVYFITYSNLQADIRERLRARPEAQMRVASAESMAGRPAGGAGRRSVRGQERGCEWRGDFSSRGG